MNPSNPHWIHLRLCCWKKLTAHFVPYQIFIIHRCLLLSLKKIFPMLLIQKLGLVKLCQNKFKNKSCHFGFMLEVDLPTSIFMICHTDNILIAKKPYLSCFRTDIGKQCRPRSDAAERGVWSGFTLFATHPTILDSKSGKLVQMLGQVR